jgi:glutaredoxin
MQVSGNVGLRCMCTSAFAILFALVLALGAIDDPAHVDVYKSVVENGNVVFRDRPTTRSEAPRIEVKVVNSHENVSVEVVTAVAPQDVVMYSTAWAGYCKQAWAYFSNQGIAFTEKDIEKSASAKREHQRSGGTGVPLIIVGNRKMKGFSAARVDQIYNAL